MSKETTGDEKLDQKVDACRASGACCCKESMKATPNTHLGECQLCGHVSELLVDICEPCSIKHYNRAWY